MCKQILEERLEASISSIAYPRGATQKRLLAERVRPTWREPSDSRIVIVAVGDNDRSTLHCPLVSQSMGLDTRFASYSRIALVNCHHQLTIRKQPETA